MKLDSSYMKLNDLLLNASTAPPSLIAEFPCSEVVDSTEAKCAVYRDAERAEGPRGKAFTRRNFNYF